MREISFVFVKKKEKTSAKKKESFICETCSADINNVRSRFLESLDSFRLWLIGVKRTLYQPSNGNYERRSSSYWSQLLYKIAFEAGYPPFTAYYTAVVRGLSSKPSAKVKVVQNLCFLG